jgi:hypothetical protein
LPVIRGVELVGVQDRILDVVLLDGVQNITGLLVDWVALVPANLRRNGLLRRGTTQ